MEIDGDKIELIERQVAENVTERVRASLFRLYAAVGVAVITVLGFVSWDIVDDVKSEIKSEIVQDIENDIKHKRTEISERATETRILARRASNVIQRVEEQLDEFEPQAADLDETIRKVRALNVTSQDLTASYSREIKPLIDNVESLSKRLEVLAVQVNQLNTLLSGDEVNVATETQQTSQQRSEVIRSVIHSSKQGREDFSQLRKKITVFFQFAGGRREQAEELSAELKARDYIVPGEDREGNAATRHEVRYFHEDDRASAQRLADDATQTLRKLGYTARNVPDVVVKSLVNYPGKKPSLGVLELWLELPQR